MATFVAHQAVVLDADTVFGIFARATSHQYNLAFSSRTTTGFTFTGEGDISAKVSGTGFVHLNTVGPGGYAYAYPILGTFQSIQASNGASLWFTVTDVSSDFAAGHPNGSVIANHRETLFAQMVGGNDDITGSPYADTLSGFGGNDVIRGGAGDDILFGGAGEDTLNGQVGNDQLHGDADVDHFVFSTALNKSTNVDVIFGFSPGQDVIELDNAIFRKLKKEGGLKNKNFDIGKKAGDKNDFIVYNKKTGDLFYDKNGSKKGGVVKFAKLDGSPDDLSSADFLVV